MLRALSIAAAAALLPASLVLAQSPPPSVYALPSERDEGPGVNAGGIQLDLQVSYFTDYLFRGVDRSDFINIASDTRSSADANFQFNAELEFDLGKLPHPFIGIFTNVLDSDPVSNFQEFRPVIGLEWAIRPVVITLAHTNYSFPDRDNLDTNEAWAKVMLDDAVLLKSEKPLLSPYVMAAYDYDQYDGWYFEFGVSHDFEIEGTGLVITALANFAYIAQYEAFAGPTGEDTGFHHYQLGLIGRYSLNTLLNVSERYGRWSLNGYLYYDDGIDDDLLSDSGFWGGFGIELRY